MSLYKQFKTDKKLETEGVILEYGLNSKKQPMRIRVARAGGANVAFSKALERATRPHRKALQSGTMDNKLADSIYKDVFAETVLLGWEGIEDENGEAMAFNKDNVVKLFTDLPDLFADVREQAQGIAIFREEVREDDLGNSGDASAMA